MTSYINNINITTPNRFLTTDIREGEDSVVFIINKTQGFINLKFEEQLGQEIAYKINLNVDKVYDLEKNKSLGKQLDILQGKILSLGNSYPHYNYLLTVDKNNTLQLLSVTLGGIPLGYKITKEVGKKIDINTLKPIWKGVYTRFVTTAFIEDIFVQKA